MLRIAELNHEAKMMKAESVLRGTFIRKGEFDASEGDEPRLPKNKWYMIGYRSYR